MHQPCGEIVPSTTLQADGGSNCLQFSQRWSPFGVSWYFTAFCGVLACARATPTPATDAPAAPAAIVRTRRRETPCCCVMTFHPEMRISRKHGSRPGAKAWMKAKPCRRALSEAMAIYKLLQNTAFEPEDIERLVSAYEQTLRALRLKDRSDPITQLVAEKIIAIGRLGIEDPAQISELVLKELTTR